MSEAEHDDSVEVAKFYVPITKAAEEERTVTGMEVEPEPEFNCAAALVVQEQKSCGDAIVPDL